MKRTTPILLYMLFALAFASAITTENKFQQYIQKTIKPVDISLGEFFAMPFHGYYGYYSYYGAFSHYSPYFVSFYDGFSNIKSNQPEYSPTTKTSVDEYFFDFSKLKFKN